MAMLLWSWLKISGAPLLLLLLQASTSKVHLLGKILSLPPCSPLTGLSSLVHPLRQPRTLCLPSLLSVAAVFIPDNTGNCWPEKTLKFTGSEASGALAAEEIFTLMTTIKAILIINILLKY